MTNKKYLSVINDKSKKGNYVYIYYIYLSIIIYLLYIYIMYIIYNIQILFRNTTFNAIVNTKIINLTNDFVLSTKRFDEPLL